MTLNILGRKGKQLCLITTEGQPCGGCTARKQQCTFNLPPLRRHRKQESASPEQWQQTPISPSTGLRVGHNPTDLMLGAVEGGMSGMVEGSGVAPPHNRNTLAVGWGRPETAQPSEPAHGLQYTDAPLPTFEPGFDSLGQDQVSGVWLNV